MSNSKLVLVGVQSPTEINAPRGCTVILQRICQLTLTRITRQVSRLLDLNDFGQIVTGVVEVHVKGEKGQKIVLRHAEVLDKDGNFYPETLRQAKSIDTFICNGEEQIFRPHFTFHGFRYISVEGMEEFTADQFFACVIHSDREKTGDFPYSNIKVNKLQSNIIWSQRDNFLIFHGL